MALNHTLSRVSRIFTDGVVHNGGPRWRFQRLTVSYHTARLLKDECMLQQSANYSKKAQGCDVVFGIHSIKPRMKKSNEDAWSVCDHEDACTFVVADGVSSWRRAGINAARFSNQLVMDVSLLASQSPLGLPTEILKACFENMVHTNSANGSCTMCMASIHKATNTLHLAWLGDCGIRVYRDNKTIYKSWEQYHTMNVPYQFGIAPSDMEFEHSKFCSIKDVMLDCINLKSGDVLLMASDGLFDNLWEDEILEILEPARLEGDNFELSNAAESLVHNASRASFDDNPLRTTPHAYKVCDGCEECMETVIGGNIDDITALIAYVV